MKDSTLISTSVANFKLRSLKDHSEYPLTQKGLLIGREVECSVCLDSGQISRYHAKIYLESGQVIVEDLRSSNGTFVNGRRVVQSQPVSLGDEIRFYDIPYRLVSVQDESGQAAETLLQMEPLSSKPEHLNPAVIPPAAKQPQPSEIWHKVQALQKGEAEPPRSPAHADPRDVPMVPAAAVSPNASGIWERVQALDEEAKKKSL